MNTVLQDILKTRTIEGLDGCKIPIESQISAGEGLHIQKVIAAIKPKTTLEIGMAYAVSTLFICEALAELGGGKHIVIDPYQNDVPDETLNRSQQPADPGWRGIGLHIVRTAGFRDMIEFYGSPSFQALPQLLNSGQKVDFALIDGMHTFDFALVDFFYIDRLLNIGGVVTFDDLFYPSIRKLCRYIFDKSHIQNFFTGCCAAQSHVFLQEEDFEALLRVPRVSGALKRWCRPELLVSDFRLGIPDKNYISLQKTTEDVIMYEESALYRSWDTHRPF